MDLNFAIPMAYLVILNMRFKHFYRVARLLFSIEKRRKHAVERLMTFVSTKSNVLIRINSRRLDLK